MIFALLVYLIGILFTRSMINNSNIPDVNPQPGSPDTEPNPSNLSLSWSLIWPIFWLKTILVFIELQREGKNKNES